MQVKIKTAISVMVGNPATADAAGVILRDGKPGHVLFVPGTDAKLEADEVAQALGLSGGTPVVRATVVFDPKTVAREVAALMRELLAAGIVHVTLVTRDKQVAELLLTSFVSKSKTAPDEIRTLVTRASNGIVSIILRPKKRPEVRHRELNAVEQKPARRVARG